MLLSTYQLAVRVFEILNTVESDVVGVAKSLKLPLLISASNVARFGPVFIVPNSDRYALVPSCNTLIVVIWYDDPLVIWTWYCADLYDDAVKLSTDAWDVASLVDDPLSILTTEGLPKSIPLLAVIRPTTSILVTSSYVRVPPIVTLPVNVAPTPVTSWTVILGVPVIPCDVVDIPAVFAYPAFVASVAIPAVVA